VFVGYLSADRLLTRCRVADRRRHGWTAVDAIHLAQRPRGLGSSESQTLAVLEFATESIERELPITAA
jgi:hypothetical protein